MSTSETGTEQDLSAYLQYYDKPCSVVMAEQGCGLLDCWAIKNALQNGGLALQYPPPPDSDQGWTQVPAPVPPA